MPAFVLTAQSLVDLRQITPDQIVLPVEPGCALEVRHGRLVVSELLAGQAKVEPCLTRVRVQAKRLHVLGDGLVVATEVGQNEPLGDVRLGQAGVKRERLFDGRYARFLQLSSEAQASLTSSDQCPGA